MFRKVKTWFKGKYRREYPRRSQDMCICNINGQTYPVENWSFGGICIQADERFFCSGQNVYFTLKFKLGMQILDVQHKAKVVRKTRSRVALKFHPLTPMPTAQLRRVISESGADQLEPA